jgi:hypothetical protein
MERLMSIKSKIAAVALVAVTAAGAMASTTQQAEARGGRNVGLGIAAGLLGAAVVGSAIAASEGYYGPGYTYGYGGGYGYRCGWVRQFDAYGNYMGRVRTCNY